VPGGAWGVVDIEAGFCGVVFVGVVEVVEEDWEMPMLRLRKDIGELLMRCVSAEGKDFLYVSSLFMVVNQF